LLLPLLLVRLRLLLLQLFWVTSVSAKRQSAQSPLSRLHPRELQHMMMARQGWAQTLHKVMIGNHRVG
jgi:hypothetical protein